MNEDFPEHVFQLRILMKFKTNNREPFLLQIQDLNFPIFHYSYPTYLSISTSMESHLYRKLYWNIIQGYHYSYKTSPVHTSENISFTFQKWNTEIPVCSPNTENLVDNVETYVKSEALKACFTISASSM